MTSSTVYAGITAEELAARLGAICGPDHVSMDADIVERYGRDQTLDLFYPVDLLVRPGSASEVAAVMKLCDRCRVPVTPRGAGSGVTGGALARKGGVVLTTERLNRIIRISRMDATVVAEAGVLNADLCAAVAAVGLHFPIAPSSSRFCSIGGNVMENAGSIHSCKYGPTGRYVLNLEVVLPSGQTIRTGADVPKNATGLNLTQLFVGSEGILGIVTKVTYRLLPAPPKELVLLAGFPGLDAALDAVAAIRQSGLQPAAVELIGPEALHLTRTLLKGPFPLAAAPVEAQLLIELQEGSTAALQELLEQMVPLLEKYTGTEILAADTSSEKEALRRLRMSIGEAMTMGGYGWYRDVDMSVPLSELAFFIREAEAASAAYDVRMICFGHVLDGNLHTMLLPKDGDHPLAKEKIEQAAEAIYRSGIARGGVISGEHGIGLLQSRFMRLQFSEAELDLMKAVKAVFDPNGILNPGKLFE